MPAGAWRPSGWRADAGGLRRGCFWRGAPKCAKVRRSSGRYWGELKNILHARNCFCSCFVFYIQPVPEVLIGALWRTLAQTVCGGSGRRGSGRGMRAVGAQGWGLVGRVPRLRVCLWREGIGREGIGTRAAAGPVARVSRSVGDRSDRGRGSGVGYVLGWWACSPIQSGRGGGCAGSAVYSRKIFPGELI